MQTVHWRGMSACLLLASMLACRPAAPAATADEDAEVNPISPCAATERQLSPQTIKSEIGPNIVQVSSGESLGTGFILRTGDSDDVLIVTNYHVIAEGEDFTVNFRRGDGRHVKVANVEVVKMSPEDDLALLRAPRMNAFGPGLELAEESDVAVGESVITLGYPVLNGIQTEPTLASGLVTSLGQTVNERPYTLTSLQLVGGNSGGPAVDSCQRVVGVTSAFHAEAKQVGLVVPSSRVQYLFSAYAGDRPPTSAEIEQRVARFVQCLQHDQGWRASTYFSRAFYRENVFPLFQQSSEQMSAKFTALQEALKYLQDRGVDIEELSAEDIQSIQQKLGIEFTPEELMVYQVSTQAKAQQWNAYATLQAFFTPFVGYLFGRVDRYRIQDIESNGPSQTVYLGISGEAGRTRYAKMTMVHEWGEWQIAGLSISSASEETTSSDGEEDAQLHDSDGRREWVPVNRRR